MRDILKDALVRCRASITQNNVEPFTSGNSAKVYATNLIAELLRLQHARNPGKRVKLLDLGCGDANNFLKLLDSFSELDFIGVEPIEEACIAGREKLKGKRGEIIHTQAYEFRHSEKADIVVSFSVLEHVYRRDEYLQCAKENLAADGVFIINYDSGHFTHPATSSERVRNSLAPIFPKIGKEQLYQAFVQEQEFAELIKKCGLNTIESLSFNSDCKEIYKRIPGAKQWEFMKEWLRLEMSLNDLGFKYDDEAARLLRTRHFILIHAR